MYRTRYYSNHLYVYQIPWLIKRGNLPEQKCYHGPEILGIFYTVTVMGQHGKTPNCIEPKTFGKIFLKRLNEQYVQQWGASITASSRFDCLNLLRTETYSKSKYVECISNPVDRLIFTRLRTDINVLQICQGRYQKQERKERKCPFCDEIEDVSHFLLKCRN